MIQISDLYVEVENKPILKGINLQIDIGEIHSIMGPNGSGKSTLFKVITGHPDYKITSGKILYRRDPHSEYENLLEKDPSSRAKLGIFMSFQNPVEVPGVNNLNFLRTSFNSICSSLGIENMDEESFLKFAKQKAKFLNLSDQILYRPLNEGLSGGEKRKNELLQMIILSPALSLLDEIDSGLDIDSIKMVSKGIKQISSKDNSFILITHYHRLLSEVQPHYVHVMIDGQIKKTGDYSLSVEINKKGYDQWI